MKRTRKEHLSWCKEQAKLQYAFDNSGAKYSDPKNALTNAVTSMISDLSKHPETRQNADMCVLLALMVNDEKSLMKFIDGFN